MENISNHSKDSFEVSSVKSNEAIELIDFQSSETTSDELIDKLRKVLPSRKLDTLDKINKSKFELMQSCKTIRFVDRNQVDKITKHIQLQDVPEQQQLAMIRDMPKSLKIKRTIKAKLLENPNQSHEIKYLSLFKRFKYSTNIFFTKRLINFRNIKFSLQLWYDSIKFIEGNFGSGIATYFIFLRSLITLNFLSCILSIIFLIIPQSFLKASDGYEFHVEDIILGNGFLENTILYYGFYSNSSIELIPGFKYEMKSAYFLTMLICYLLTFVFLSIKVVRTYRRCYIESSGDFHNFATKIFFSWDYSISSGKAARICSSSIYREFKEFLAESVERKNLSFSNRLMKLLIRMNVTILVLALIVGSGAIIWILLRYFKSDEEVNSSPLFIISLIITLIINIFPILISQLEKFEDYSSKFYTLYITLIRIYSMMIVIIGTVLVYWFSFYSSSCWQTKLAEEIYRLIILDFLISIIGRFIIQLIHYYIFKLIWIKIGPPKFDIAQNTLNLIYNQILFWISFYLSPPLAFIIIIKLLLTFYIKKWGLINCCETPVVFWKAAQTQTLFLALIFFAMTLTLTMYGFVFSTVQSNECGPFKNTFYTWQTVIQDIFNIPFDSNLWKIIVTLSKPGIGAAIIIAMSTIVYYFREKTLASKKMVEILREMLILQSCDKDFLLHEFSKVADENWLQRRSAFNENRMSIDSRKIPERIRPTVNFTTLVKTPHNRSNSFHLVPGTSRD